MYQRQIGTVTNYLVEVRDALNQRNGQRLANLLSHNNAVFQRNAQKLLANERNLEPEYVSRYIHGNSNWSELVSAHLKTCLSYWVDDDVMEAFQWKTQMVQAMTRMLSAEKEQNWFLPLMNQINIEIRILAMICDKEKNRHSSKSLKPDEHLEKAADLLMGVFRVAANDSRAPIEVSKRKGMIHIINQLFKIYFRINKLHLCKPLIRALENANLMHVFPLAQRVTYSYFLGMKSMFDSDFKAAEQHLGFAFRNCHPESHKNKRLILIFLIPVKCLLGQMPTQEALDTFRLTQFNGVLKAVKEGNLKAFDAALEHNAAFFWKFNIYLILEKLKIVAYRNLFKRVAHIVKTHQIPMDSFLAAFRFSQDDESITLEEVHCILANLIYEGKVKGYISLQHQKLVISKQNPFPSIASVA